MSKEITEQDAKSMAIGQAMIIIAYEKMVGPHEKMTLFADDGINNVDLANYVTETASREKLPIICHHLSDGKRIEITHFIQEDEE